MRRAASDGGLEPVAPRLRKAGRRFSVGLNDFGPTQAGKAKNAVVEVVGRKVVIVSSNRREAAAGLIGLVTATLK